MSAQKHKKILEKTIAFFVSLILVLLAGLFLSAPIGRAAGASAFVQFGGYEDSIVPNPTPGGMFICPTYTLVTNISTTDGLPPEFGVYIPLILPGTTFAYSNLITPGVPIIGGVLPVPCPAPVPVYPLYYDAPFYLAGTGAY
jgi:hypothetical protein